MTDEIITNEKATTDNEAVDSTPEVFEESSTKPDISTTEDYKHRISVLFGMHRGASSPCPEKFNLGGTNGDDIQLQDTELENLSINIEQSPETELGYSLSLNKQPDQEEDQTKELQVGQIKNRLYLKFGEVIIAVSSIDDEIDSDNIDNVEFRQVILTTVGEEDSNNGEDSTQALEDIENDDEIDGDDDDDFDQEGGDEIDWEATEIIRGRWFRYFTAASVIVLTSIFIILATKITSEGINKEEKIAVNCSQEASNVIGEYLSYPLQQHSINTPKGEVIKIQGAVDSFSVIERARQKLDSFDCNYEWDLVSLNESLSEISQFMSARHSSALKISGDASRMTVKVVGFISQPGQWNNTKQSILSMLDSRLELEEAIVFTDQAEEFLTNILSAKELSGYVFIMRTEDDQLKANMVFQPKILKKWQDVHRTYQQEFPNAPKIPMEEMHLGQLGIRAIAMGETPRVVLSNGQSYLRGSIFPNGAILTDIQPDAITLETPQGSVKYPVFQGNQQTFSSLPKNNNTKLPADLQKEKAEEQASWQQRLSYLRAKQRNLLAAQRRNTKQAYRSPETKGAKSKEDTQIQMISEYFFKKSEL